MREFCLTTFVLLLMASGAAAQDHERTSLETQDCLGCHTTTHPGMVESWRKSRHANTTPGEAMQAEPLALKVSSKDVPENLQKVTVGCAECHTLRPDKHQDTFDHMGYQVHVVVSPDDCATCHSEEREQFSHNLMSQARTNFVDNPLYQDLQRVINGQPVVKDGRVEFEPTEIETYRESCLYCHGTKLTVTGTETRDTDFGVMDFPLIDGWPNQGVGRENLDGSLGTCSACHTRHSFSIEMARKPYTCKECHVGPDVPAFKVYEASKHGNIHSALGHTWDFKPVPWTIGKDFTAPTCASCHVSLLTNTDGEVVVERTHRMNDRLPWRIFGLIYAHPHPRDANLTKISTSGLPLPTDFEGNFAEEHLVDKQEQQKRLETMQASCKNCHDTSWVKGHFDRFEHTIHATNRATRTATKILENIWAEGLAQGPAQGGSPFDEVPERMWSDIWLLYANHIRFASAMAGGGDYGTFADGRYAMAKEIVKLQDWYESRRKAKELQEGEAGAP